MWPPTTGKRPARRKPPVSVTCPVSKTEVVYQLGTADRNNRAPTTLPAMLVPFKQRELAAVKIV